MNKLVFLAHPIELAHLYSLLGCWSAAARCLPGHFLKKTLFKIPPYKYADINTIRSLTGEKVSGYAVLCPLLPEQIASIGEARAVDMVVRAVKRGEKLKADLAVLGGFTSVVGNEGEEVSKRVNMKVTSGNTYTAVLAIEGIYKAIELLGLDIADMTAAVIGATGDIGSACARVLSDKVRVMNIAARNYKKINEFAEHLRISGSASVKVFKNSSDAVIGADIILTATSALTTLIDPKRLKTGAIVCDVAIPANIAREVAVLRDDVFVFEGGLARLPFPEDASGTVWKRAMPKNSLYGCLAEGMLLCLENRIENFSVGRGNISEQKMRYTRQAALKHGFSVSDFFCGRKFYTEEDICRVREKITKKNRSFTWS